MTVLAWLLLYATVIQLGQSNYSISSEDGTHEVNSYANSTFPSIDRSQIRRSRRSVDSDLEDAQKAFDQAGETLKRVTEDIANDKAKLKDLEKDLTTAQTVAGDKDTKLKNAANRDTQLIKVISDADAAITVADTEYTAAKAAFDTKMGEWKTKTQERDISEGAYNKAKEAKSTAETELTDAKTRVTEMAGLTTKYNDEEKKKKDYDDTINLYDENLKLVTIIEKEEEKIKNNQLKKVLEDAKKDKGIKDKEKLAIDSNEILNGNIDENFGDSTVKDVQTAKGSAIFTLKEELKTKKDTPEGDQLRKDLEAAQRVWNAVLGLMDLDPNNKEKTIKDLKASYSVKAVAVNKAATEAANAVTKAQTELDDANNAINVAQTKLNGVDMKALEAEKKKAVVALPIVEGNIRTYTDELNTFSTKNGGLKGPTEWAKLKTTLDGAVTTKTTGLDTAKQAEKAALTDYDTKKNTAKNFRDGITPNEEKTMTEKLAVKTKLEKDRKTAQTEKDELKDYYDNAKVENATANANVLNVKGLISQQEELIKHKQQNDEYNALTAERTARDAVTKATERKAEADAQAKKQAEDAAAEAKNKEEEAQAAAKKEREHQDQVRSLGLGFGITAAIVVIGAAVGLSVFLVMRRRRKQKKEAAAKVPKREELDAPNGLTIIRREGMQDKYVIKGDDFNFRGPLVRGRVHNEVPTKHMLDDQVGGDKIENIFFDKKLNDAYLIGEGVEIIEEDSVSVSEGKKTGRIDPVELFANMSAEDMAGSSQKYIKDTDAKAAPPGDKKSSKSKRAQSSTPKKTGAAPDGETAPLLGENKKA